MPQSVLIDTDPGVDDAMALLFALRSPELEVLALSTVFGNTGAEQTALNALRVLEAGGRPDIPVAAGASRPLVRPPRVPNPSIHGADGLGGAFVDDPPPAGRPIAASGPELIARTVLERPGEVTLIAVGPLTNLALAARLEPRVVGAVRRVIIMGGAAYHRGNASPVAESNIRDDPEAAAVVFGAGWPLVMVGLDVTMRVVMNDAHLAELATGGSPATDFIARILPAYRGFYRSRWAIDAELPPYRPDGVPTHDPSAIAYAIRPDLFRTKRLPVWVETEGRTAGLTAPDPHGFWGQAPEVGVCLEVDAAGVLALIRERLLGSG